MNAQILTNPEPFASRFQQEMSDFWNTPPTRPVRFTGAETVPAMAADGRKIFKTLETLPGSSGAKF